MTFNASSSPCPNDTHFASNSSALRFLTKACDCDLPMELCVYANCMGLLSTVVWFAVLVPQLRRNYRHQSCEGLSLPWALMNFTAAFNNVFFVFKLPIQLPFYSYIMGAYLSALTGLLLVQYWWYTRKTREMYVWYGCFGAAWLAIIICQFVFDIYQYMEWVSIMLWSAETFPQLFLNTRRTSTHGISNTMILLTTIGKTSDFINTYALIMPLQYVVMTYFSSSTAFVGTIQVLYYWKRIPQHQYSEESHDEMAALELKYDENFDNEVIVVQRSTSAKRTLRLGLIVVLCVILAAFCVGIVYRTHTFLALLAPIGTYGVIAGVYAYFIVRAKRSKQLNLIE